MDENSIEIEETIRTLDAIFNAQSIAVVGASSEPGKFGYMTLDSIIRGGYGGRVYPVNPKGGSILGLKAYSSIGEIPDRLDAVVVVVPAKFVSGVLKEAAVKGAKGAVIQSAGFREAGRKDLEDELVQTAQSLGMRLLGPNIQGINYLPNRFCAMFFPVIDLGGPLAVVTQSGTITTALSEWAAGEGLGISAAVNLGNQADLCECDYIDYFSEDRNTRAVAMFLDSVKDGPRFLAALRRARLKKPVAILKAGRTEAGARSAASHTGSMAGSHAVFSALCRQEGAAVAFDLETLYDQAKALATLKPPRGRRLLIVSTSGGAATLACDEAETLGLTLPGLPPELGEGMKRMGLPPLAKFHNPVDLVSLDAQDFKKVALLADRFEAADTILISFGDPVPGAVEVVRELTESLRASLAVSYMGGGAEETRGRFAIQRFGIPVFPSPERAVRGIAAAAWRAEYCRTRGLAGREETNIS